MESVEAMQLASYLSYSLYLEPLVKPKFYEKMKFMFSIPRNSKWVISRNWA